MKKKTILLAFASSDLKKSVERFQIQAQNSGYYNQIRIFTEKNIDEICLSKVKEIIKKSGGRGFGYWFWKPYLIEKILNLALILIAYYIQAFAHDGCLSGQIL